MSGEVIEWQVGGPAQEEEDGWTVRRLVAEMREGSRSNANEHQTI